MNPEVTETTNSTPSGANKTEKTQKNVKTMSPSMYREVRHMVTVPVSFYTLPLIIDELWNTFSKVGGETFNQLDIIENKNIFKKVMLILAEAKVCYAQLHIRSEDLPQKNLYFHLELVLLESLAKQLPYPLALYLDCLGNTVEGKLSVTPVLTKIEGAISLAPRQLLPSILWLKTGTRIYSALMEKLKKLPNFTLEQRRNNEIILSQGSIDFWLTYDERIKLTDGEIQIFHKIIESLEDKVVNVRADLFSGKGSMAQTVQMTEWYMNQPCRNFCMTDISEYDQRLGATFGFGFTQGCEVQKSRYTGPLKDAYLQGEIIPGEMLKSMLGYQQDCELKKNLAE